MVGPSDFLKSISLLSSDVAPFPPNVGASPPLRPIGYSVAARRRRCCVATPRLNTARLALYCLRISVARTLADDWVRKGRIGDQIRHLAVPVEACVENHMEAMARLVGEEIGAPPPM